VAELGSVSGKRIAVWGLTYKPGTDTLRRSTSVELCRWLVGHGSTVRVHDPAATSLPGELNGVERFDSPIAAAESASALVVATEWPEYRAVNVEQLAAAMPTGLVVDANRFLAKTLGNDRRFRIISVGQVNR
jgi:UDPglucose 6-dehydrogenase